MRIAMFCHSLLSDWNHGNAHFLRGVASELQGRGHEVSVFEPEDGWSLRNLVETQGAEAVEGFHRAYPTLTSRFYDGRELDLDAMLDGVDLVLVHEWSTHDLVRKLGAHRARTGRYALLFHDTHHRAITDRAAMASYDLRHYDGVLAFGRVLRDMYLAEGWSARAWVWHEAADTRVFHPHPEILRTEDVVWIGNWGDEERTHELRTFFLEPVKALGLRAVAYGVRYPEEGRAALAAAGVVHGGWLANHAVPRVYGGARVALHVPRGPYVRRLPGIPTIRVFEALACGVPLACAPWSDSEALFHPGRDFLVAGDGAEMRAHLARLLGDPDYAAEIAENGRATVWSRHTCSHRVDELLAVYDEISHGGRSRRRVASAPQSHA